MTCNNPSEISWANVDPDLYHHKGSLGHIELNYIDTGNTDLTHLPLDKMAAILEDDNFKCIFLNQNDRIPIRISLKFVSRSPIDNITALFLLMAWCRPGDKPLTEPMLTHFIDAYMRHSGEIS